MVCILSDVFLLTALFSSNLSFHHELKGAPPSRATKLAAPVRRNQRFPLLLVSTLLILVVSGDHSSLSTLHFTTSNDTSFPPTDSARRITDDQPCFISTRFCQFIAWNGSCLTLFQQLHWVQTVSLGLQSKLSLSPGYLQACSPPDEESALDAFSNPYA